jgi:hypothetical protein
MPPTISAQQRDALYNQIVDRLSGIDDIRLAIDAGNFDAAERLGREFSDLLRLVGDDLGWGTGGAGTIELSTLPDVLRRALARLREMAASHDRSNQELRDELRENEGRNRLVVEACDGALAELAAS